MKVLRFQYEKASYQSSWDECLEQIKNEKLKQLTN